MLVSVIIATKNEERNIEFCLRSVLAQTYPKEDIEIIVVDNYSPDRTVEIINELQKEFASLNLKVFNRGPERSAQRNYGVWQSQGKYILYLDADMELGEKVIEECAERVENNKEIVGLYIPEKITGESFWSKVRNFERSFYDGTVIDAVRFVRREKFLEAGGFDEKLYACEDWDLDKRLKELGEFSMIKSRLYHNESYFSLKKYLAKKKYYSRNVGVYIEKWGRDDPDIKKQFGFWYRYFGVFTEKGKRKKLLRHPILAGGMYFLRFLVGAKYLVRNRG